MRILTFGNPGANKMLLVHGAQTPWQVWRPYIDHFSRDYHLLIPVLPGHDTEETSTFTTLEQIAAEIEDYCLQNWGSDLSAVCGMSLGGAISVLLWTNGKLNIKSLVVDGAPLIPQHKFLTKMLATQYISLTRKTKLRERKTLDMAEKQFISKAHMPPFLELMDVMSEETITNFTTSIGQYRLVPAGTLSPTKVLYCYGTSLNETLSKKSAKRPKHFYPDTVTKRFDRYNHCELSIFNPAAFISVIEDFI